MNVTGRSGMAARACAATCGSVGTGPVRAGKLNTPGLSQRSSSSSYAISAPLMPEHIARMALFLAADDSALCTAQDFIVDGGWA